MLISPTFQSWNWQLSNKPQKDELEMFVDSMNRMATGFHRLEFRLTKAIKMIDKFVTAVWIKIFIMWNSYGYGIKYVLFIEEDTILHGAVVVMTVR
jgi:hypothetical protein